MLLGDRFRFRWIGQLGLRRGGFRVGVGIQPRFGQAGGGTGAGDRFAVDHLKMRATSLALSGHDQRRFQLDMPAFGACQFDTLACGWWLTDHGDFSILPRCRPGIVGN